MSKWDDYDVSPELIAQADQYEQSYRDKLQSGVAELVKDKLAGKDVPVSVMFKELYGFVRKNEKSDYVLQNVCFWLVTAMEILAAYEVAGKEMLAEDDGTLLAMIQAQLGLDSLGNLDWPTPETEQPE